MALAIYKSEKISSVIESIYSRQFDICGYGVIFDNNLDLYSFKDNSNDRVYQTDDKLTLPNDGESPLYFQVYYTDRKVSYHCYVVVKGGFLIGNG